MAKELNTWLDEFVEKGADPKNVDNWPQSSIGSIGAATGIDIYNLWVNYFKMLDEELAKKPDCNQYRLILSADKMVEFLEKCGVDTSAKFYYDDKIVNGEVVLSSGLYGIYQTNERHNQTEQAYPFIMWDEKINNASGIGSTTYLNIRVLGGVVLPYWNSKAVLTEDTTIEEAIHYCLRDGDAIKQFNKNPIYSLPSSYIDIVGVPSLTYTNKGNFNMLNYDFEEFLSLFDVEYYYETPGR